LRRVRANRRRWMEIPTAAAPQRLPVVEIAQEARILGLDPGSLVTGYAVIECCGAETRYVASGGVRTSAGSLPQRLQEIFSNVSRLVLEFRPDEIAIERIFVHRNASSALKLGQARGAALCGTFALQLPVYEYAPREVKLAVVGTGAAQKEQVQLMVRQLLQLTQTLGADAADAVAIAMCHAHTRRLGNLLARMAGGAA
jgi:crossover junction endodeoxyribonuclease RuvC